MDSEDSAPEDMPISAEPLDVMFSKRLTAKKIQRERKLATAERKKTSSLKLAPLPEDVIESLSRSIPKSIVPTNNSSSEKTKKKKKDVKKKKKSELELFEEATKKLPDFIPLDNIKRKCSTKFKVGILDSIVKNPANKNYKEYTLYHSKNAKNTRQSNVKSDIVKKALMKRVARI